MVPTAFETNGGRELRWVLKNLAKHYLVDFKTVSCWKYGDPTSRKRIIIVALRRDIFDGVVEKQDIGDPYGPALKFEWPDEVCDESWYATARDIAEPDEDVPGSPDEEVLEWHPDGIVPLGKKQLSYWRHDVPRIEFSPHRAAKPGKLQHLGYQGTESMKRAGKAGHSKWPRNIQGWDGSWATQLGTGGGSRRVRLSWKPGDPLTPTRMTTIRECCRVAGLDEESYLRMAKRFYRKELGMTFDQWVRELVNLGVPVNTGVAIDRQIHSMLERAGVKPQDPIERHSKQAFTLTRRLGNLLKHCPECEVNETDWPIDDGLITPCDTAWYASGFTEAHGPQPSSQARAATQRKEKPKPTGRLSEPAMRLWDVNWSCADSGATDHLHDSSVNPLLQNASRATALHSYQTAGGGCIHGDMIGDLPISVLNLNDEPDLPDIVDTVIRTTTVKGLGHSALFSLDQQYREGYNITLSHDGFTGLHRPAGSAHGPESSIPVVYNWEGRCGWQVPYVVRRPGDSDKQHRARCKAILAEHQDRASPREHKALHSHLYSALTARRLEEQLLGTAAVAQTLAVRVPGERNIRPAFRYGNLRRYKNKNWHEFHSALAHMGEPAIDCAVCAMYKGASRRIPRHTQGKPRDTRPGAVWHMDMIVFRDRSEEGCRYLIALTDECTQAVQLIPLYYKSDATFELRRWIKSLRSHPALVGIHGKDYSYITKIVTDNDGAWNEDNEEFQSMLNEFIDTEAKWGGPIEMQYGDPQDHARDNARAEGMNKIIEAGIQSLLYEQNLPPTWWQRAAADVQLIANRLCPYSLDANTPPDQDAAAPIERLLHGYVSRHQVYAELDAYVSVGTPALCKTGSKGSSLEPRVRWGIAIANRGRVVKWMCPFTGTRFRTSSFTAFTLKSGMNFSQFLGLGDIAPSKQSQMLPQDEGTQWTIELPAVRDVTTEVTSPVRRILSQANGESATADEEPAGIQRQYFEYFPRPSRRKANPLGGADMIDDEDEGNTEELEQEAEAPRLTINDGTGSEVVIPTTTTVQSDDSESDGDDPPTIDNSGGFNSHHDGEAPAPAEPTRPAQKRGRPRSKRSSKSPKRRHRKRIKASATGLDFSAAEQEKLKALMDEELVVELDSEVGLPPDQADLLEKHEAALMRKHSVVTDGRVSFERVCKIHHSLHHELPQEHHQTYRLWLLTKPKVRDEQPLYVEDLPKKLCESRASIEADLTLPYPSGPHWNRLVSNAHFHEQQHRRIHPDDIEEEQAYAAQRIYQRLLEDPDVPKIALLCASCVAEQADMDRVKDLVDRMVRNDLDMLGLTRRVANKAVKNRRTSIAVGAGEIPEPKSMVEALMSDRAEGWVESINKEMQGLMDQQVFSKGWTPAMLQKAGIRGDVRSDGTWSTAIPLSICLTHKMKDGVLEKLKTRICIAGHKGNVTQGIHYNEVFSPSPVQHTERLLQAMMVNLHLERLTCDVKQAYTWAPLPPGERVAVEYPDGFKPGPGPNGETLYMVLERNLYGMPSAARGWGLHRDKFILQHFNEGNWRCTRSRMDPCLFVIDRLPTIHGTGGDSREPRSARQQADPPAEDIPHRDLPTGEEDMLDVEDLKAKGIHRSWVLIHTDDCDMYGTSSSVLQEINQALDDEWKTEIVPSEFVLGVKRTLHRGDDGWKCTVSMTSFIDDMVSTFQSDLDSQFGKRTVSIPFPEGLILSKSDEPAEGEVQRNIKRGYQKLVGSLLWCVRHVSPISTYGCSQLCKLMATPTDKAWEAALHLLQYLRQNRTRGVVFSETDHSPFAMVDASNRDDPSDGRTQYGYAIHWGGPLITKSGKLNHVGINSTYNEYMALHHCVKQLVWLRQLMQEIGLASYVRSPTQVYADNKQANKLCAEDLVTAGNMYFRTGYHYNKEAVRDGYVDIRYINTAYNISDACTKALAKNKISLFEPALHGHEVIDVNLIA